MQYIYSGNQEAEVRLTRYQIPVVLSYHWAPLCNHDNAIVHSIRNLIETNPRYCENICEAG